jgi:uncharacterized protein
VSDRVFVDTSAILALMVPSDRAHAVARRSFERLEAARAPLVTTSYVLVETYALLRSRFGLEAVRSFREDFAPLLDVIWIDEGVHNRALDSLIDQELGCSLVDATSFEVIESSGIGRAFVFDRHFAGRGFGLD